MNKKGFLLVGTLLLLLQLSAVCQENNDFYSAFTYRNMSPHRVGSWVNAIAVPETQDPDYKYTFYVAGRHSGVWKTINNGISFEPIFEDYGTTSIGCIAVARAEPATIWVGTGESSSARSAHAGNGIYKSVNGGKSFECMGLEDSHHIPKIVIHPEDPDIVYAAVMGHLYTNNEERGVFMTTNGGKSWKKVLYINERTGVIDIEINPEDPEIIYAVTYDMARYPWHLEAGGSESAIYKSTNGGKKWKRLEGGLPAGKLGRIGIDIYRSNPDVLYAVIENLNLRKDITIEETGGDNHLRDNYFDRFVGGEVYKTLDAGIKWVKMNSDSVDLSEKAAYSFNKILVDPKDDNNLFVSSEYIASSHDAGKTWQDVKYPSHLFVNMFGDIREMWIDPYDPRHMIIGSDGGVYISYDAGKHLQHLYHLPFGEMYSVETDMETPYNVYVGLQDHEGWKAPSNGSMGHIGTPEWQVVGMWDGMYHCVDKTDSRWLYFTTQFGAHHRVDQAKGERVRIEPKAPEGAPPYRYTWNTPLAISPHNSSVLYTGGQMLLRSADKGDTWEEISPDLTTNDSIKIAGKGHIQYCTIAAIAESPVKAGVIWTGTDDGHVHVTEDNGKSWFNATPHITKLGIPEERWVTRIIPSHHDPAVAYLVKNGYSNDDFTPYVALTEDYGKSWKLITDGLPQQAVTVVCEDDVNPDLLFLGNDHGIYLSFDKGQNWTNFNLNIPSVPVKDIKIHPRDRDLLVASYGRGLYITDIYPFMELNKKVLDEEVHLFSIEPKPQMNYSQQAYWGISQLMGDNQLNTPNEPNGISIYFYLKNTPYDKAGIEIKDLNGKSVWKREVTGKEGFNKVTWNTARTVPGEYKVILTAEGKQLEGKATVQERWRWPVGSTGRSGYLAVEEENECSYDIDKLEAARISSPPSNLNLDPFYKKYTNANGIHIIGSQKVPDKAFTAASRIISFMTEALPEEVYNSLVEHNTRVGIMARYEGTTDIPEHANLVRDTSLNWDVRARGLGGTLRTPLNTCAEENLLCYQIDKYHAEDILIHEFAHTIHGVGILPIDPGFNERLQKSLNRAIAEGKWDNSYAATNIWEYWAEGVQTWFNVNGEVAVPDGKHNQVNLRKELKSYDPGLYAILSDYFPETDECISCKSSTENKFTVK